MLQHLSRRHLMWTPEPTFSLSRPLAETHSGRQCFTGLWYMTVSHGMRPSVAHWRLWYAWQRTWLKCDLGGIRTRASKKGLTGNVVYWCSTESQRAIPLHLGNELVSKVVLEVCIHACWLPQIPQSSTGRQISCDTETYQSQVAHWRSVHPLTQKCWIGWCGWYL